MDLTQKLPDTMKFSYEPYTYGAVITDLKFGDYNGYPLLEGTVKEGKETSRLFHATATKDIAGKKVIIYGIKQWEIDQGSAVRVAM